MPHFFRQDTATGLGLEEMLRSAPVELASAKHMWEILHLLHDAAQGKRISNKAKEMLRKLKYHDWLKAHERYEKFKKENPGALERERAQEREDSRNSID